MVKFNGKVYHVTPDK